jgi:hypothetical protein
VDWGVRMGLAGHSAVANEVRQLPPLPGSAALYLSAVASIGGWYALRSARNLSWGALPDWYHTGGPSQIGHASPFDLNFHALPLRMDHSVDVEVGERHFYRRRPRETTPLGDRQCFLTITAPRGPPLLSF